MKVYASNFHKYLLISIKGIDNQENYLQDGENYLTIKLDKIFYK